MADQYAVIGNPIGHSKSPMIHTMFALATAQDLQYSAVESPLQGFAATLDRLRHAGARGVNVTAPFKLDAFAYAGRHSAAARLAGAANALKFEGGKVWAENFDGIGLVRDVTHNLARPMQGQRVLVLGAGGAVRGALLPFLAQRPMELVVANRDVAKARALVQQLPETPGCAVRADSYPGLAGQRFDIVFNATSASLRAELPPVPAEVFAPGALAYELAYAKGLTPFLLLARNAGVERLADGVGMLVEQAAEAFAWWRGVRPDTAPVIRQLTVPLH